MGLCWFSIGNHCSFLLSYPSQQSNHESEGECSTGLEFRYFYVKIPAYITISAMSNLKMYFKKAVCHRNVVKDSLIFQKTW